MLQYRNQTREQAIGEMLPEAEERLKNRLVLLNIIEHEQLDISEGEVQEEANTVLHELDEQTITALTQQQELTNQLLNNVANAVLNRKLRERIRQIEAKALRKLRHPSRSKKLRSFVESL
ncbi:MAG: hypothetical protein HC828_16480 [Blastochloris sp.]|nr:hypothetical protein [Blastochloris sp.]